MVRIDSEMLTSALPPPRHGLRTLVLPLVSLICGLPAVALADAQTGLSFKILDERKPAGGTVQLRLTLTEPKPIITATGCVGGPSPALGAVQAVTLFDPNTAAAAVSGGGCLSVSTVSTEPSFGTAPGVPLMAVTMPVSASASVGDSAPLTLDAAASVWIDPAGLPYPQSVRDGAFTVGGTLSITGVVPGGGALPAGTVITLEGLGFQPGALAEIDGVRVGPTAFVSATRLEVPVIDPVPRMESKRIRVRNPDLARAAFFSYLRTTPVGQTARPLLAATIPVLLPDSFSSAFFALPERSAGRFFGLALQNSGADASDVSIELRSGTGAVLASATVQLASATRYVRETSEIFGGLAPPSGSVLAISASRPVQILGLAGDEARGVVEPRLAALALP